MIIKIENGIYTKSEVATALLSAKEEEYLAALAQKLVVRQERQKAEKELEEQRLQEERKRQRQIKDNKMFFW